MTTDPIEVIREAINRWPFESEISKQALAALEKLRVMEKEQLPKDLIEDLILIANWVKNNGDECIRDNLKVVERADRTIKKVFEIRAGILRVSDILPELLKTCSVRLCNALMDNWKDKPVSELKTALQPYPQRPSRCPFQMTNNIGEKTVKELRDALTALADKE